ncbi:4-hydroxyphenylacetate 3-hydroxylase N-terminal domain-containing protein [Thermodesulfobacteriota bacterium]
MAIRTAEQYRESVRDDRMVYFNGERVKDVTQNPSLRVSVEQCAVDYWMTEDPRYRDLLVEENENGEPVSFVFTEPRSTEDLLRRREIIELQSRICFGEPAGAKFTGIDGLNAVGIVCKRMDKELGTNYYPRVEAYRKYLQETDIALAALCMTDVKGDRSLRPSKQASKDFYLRLVERKKDGIVVRGAKQHIGFACSTNDMIVMPCRNHGEADKDCALVFVIPINTKGITIIPHSRNSVVEGDFLDHPIQGRCNAADGLVVFDDVFVPMEGVFLCEEWQYSGEMAYMFANFHRLGGDTYKYPRLEILVGAAKLMAEYNGIDHAPHIQEKLSWLAMYIENVGAMGKVACENCMKEPDSDLVYPNPMYSNISKMYFADNYHQALKHIQDIAGGLAATIPSSKDFYNPETRPLMERYYTGKEGIPAEHRIRAVKLVADLSSTYCMLATIHGEGSLAAQRMSIYQLADWERYKAAAKRAAGIDDGKEHPIFSDLPEFPQQVLK